MTGRAEGKKADFGRLYDRAFEDLDFQRLFDPALDGIEESEVGRYLGMGSHRFEDWFKPFRENEPVHPYAEGDGK